MGRNARAADGPAAPPATRGEPGPQAAAPVVHVLASPHGGGAVHVRTLTTGLARRGVSILVAMPFDGGHVSAEDFTRAGVGIAQWRMDGSLRGIASLAAILRVHRPRLIHTHGSRAAALSWAAVRLARPPRPAQVHSVHGFVTPFHAQPRRCVQRMTERAVARSCHAILAGSSHERDGLIAARIAAPERVIAIRPGIDTARFAAVTPADRQRAREHLAIDDGKLVVISVCRLDRPRDFPTLLHAFARFAAVRGDADLLIVGDGPERPRIATLVEQLGLAGRVSLAGLQRDAVPYYAAADVFVSTSYGWEALGLATVEAQAAGLPVVVTDAGGAAEAFVPGTTGLLVPPRDPEALANALGQLAADGAQRRTMGAAGRAYAAAQFAVEPMVDAVLEIYRSSGATQ